MVYGRRSLKPEGAGSNPAGATINKCMRVDEVIRLGQVNTGPANEFLQDFENMSDEHPFNHKARVVGGAAIKLGRYQNRIHISDITSLEPGKGHGGTAMKMLIKLAHKHNVGLELFAKAYRDDRMSTEQLVKWYQKLGFHIVDDLDDLDLDDGVEMRYYVN